MDRRTLGLGIAAVVAVGAVVAVTIGHHRKHTSRDAVASYVDEVNTIQDDLRYPLTKVEVAYRTFGSGGSLDVHQAEQLRTAQQTLIEVQRRVARLQSPPQARRLRRLIVRLVGDEASITHEVALLAAFLPGFEASMRNVHAASAQLGAALARIHPPASHAIRGTKKQIRAAQTAFTAAATKAASLQAEAIRAYDRRIEAGLRQLSRLTPPPAFAPALRTQRRTLRTTRDAGERLVAGLTDPNRSDVPRLGRAFTVASRSSQAISAQRAEIAAVRAYNARVRALGNDAIVVRAEVVRLQRALP